MSPRENINKFEKAEIILTEKIDGFVRKGLTKNGANMALLFLIILFSVSSLFLGWVLTDRPDIPLTVSGAYFTLSFFASAMAMRYIPYYFIQVPERLKQLIGILLWPSMVALPLSLACYELSLGNNPIDVLFLAMPLLLTIISLLERLLPFNDNWQYSGHDFKTDLLFEAIPRAFVAVMSPLLVYFAAYIGLSFTENASEPGELQGAAAFFNQLPFWFQVVAFILVQDFFSYWGHRIGHETSLLWKFHSTHHYVLNLTWFNYNRHPLIPVTNIIAGVFAVIFVLIFQPSIELIGFVALSVCVTGPMLHCNIKINTRGLEVLFATPAMHRWHHDPKAEISDNNYAFYVSIWDRLFGTFYLPNDQGPRVIGSGVADIPSTFVAQAVYPFIKLKEFLAKTKQ